jgi:protein TonB
MAVKSGSIDGLREHYGTCIRYSFLAAVFIHFCIFYFSPPFEFRPYTIEFEDPMEPIVLPDDIRVDPPPPPVKHPPVEIEPADVGETAADAVIPENVPYGDDLFVPSIGAVTTQPEPYYHFEEYPALVRYVSPVYPELARQAGIEGTVLLSVLVGTDGAVKELGILRSDVTPAMEKAAIAAVRLFEFRPAMQNAKPVKARISIPIIFRLD